MKMVNEAARVAGMIGDIKRVCARSFFNGEASRRIRRRRALSAAAVTMCTLIVMGAALIGARFSLAVYVGGEEVGTAKSIADVPAIVASAESQLTELLGYDYSLSGTVSLAASVGSGAEIGDIAKNIILSVEGVEELYAITIDGEVAAASADEDVLYGVLRELLAKYMNENTVSARFLENVMISRELVTEDTPRDLKAIRALLSPEGGQGLLTVESVVAVLHDEELPFGTEYVDDSTLYEDESCVVTAGAPGSAVVTEHIIYINGVETGRRDAGSVVTSMPVAEVVALGTMPRPVTASYGSYVWPAEGVITSSFGYRRTTIGSRDHKGLDIAGFKGQDIYAADGGVVTFSGESSGYGLVVIILHDNGEETVYGHCSKLLVSEGESVYQGQVIAAMGRTGVASGVHCHFEIRVNGTQIDPQTRLGTSER